MVSGENNSQQVSAYGWKGINVPLEDEGKVNSVDLSRAFFLILIRK
jgi:hypothetical protein